MPNKLNLNNKDGRYIVRRLISHVEGKNKKAADRKDLCNHVGEKGKVREGIKYILNKLHKIEAGLILTDHEDSRLKSLTALHEFMEELLHKEEIKLVLQGNRKRRCDEKKRKQRKKSNVKGGKNK